MLMLMLENLGENLLELRCVLCLYSVRKCLVF